MNVRFLISLFLLLSSTLALQAQSNLRVKHRYVETDSLVLDPIQSAKIPQVVYSLYVDTANGVVKTYPQSTATAGTYISYCDGCAQASGWVSSGDTIYIDSSQITDYLTVSEIIMFLTATDSAIRADFPEIPPGDSLYSQFCNGCAQESGWKRSGDTLYIDTSSTTIIDYYTQAQVIQLLADTGAAIRADFPEIPPGDSLYSQFCNGCAQESGWKRSGDTLYIDTSSTTITDYYTQAQVIQLLADTGTAIRADFPEIPPGDSLYSQYCDGCALASGWVHSGDTIYIDTSSVAGTTYWVKDADTLSTLNDESLMLRNKLYLDDKNSWIGRGTHSIEVLQNGNFETFDGSFTSWLLAGGSGSPSADTADGYNGYAAEVFGNIYQNVQLSANVQYTLSVWYRNPSGAMGITVQKFTSPYNFLVSNNVSTIHSDWTNYTTTFTPTTSGTYSLSLGGGSFTNYFDLASLSYTENNLSIASDLQLHIISEALVIDGVTTGSSDTALVIDAGQVYKRAFPVSSDDQTATEVPISDVGSYYSSSHVEGALQEIGLDISTLQSGGSDNWGNQVVVSDATITGDGTLGDPLSVVDSWYNSLAELQAAVSNDFHNLGGTDSVSVDTFLVQYCDGCALSSGWVRSGDTIYIDTTSTTITDYYTQAQVIQLLADTGVAIRDDFPVDSILVQYCDGCALASGWIRSGDTIYIDTSSTAITDYYTQSQVIQLLADTATVIRDDFPDFPAGDTIYTQYCDGCALASGWIRSGDTIYIDTSSTTITDYYTQAQVIQLLADTGAAIRADFPVNTDDQTAEEVTITDAGAYYSSSHVEGALQEIGLDISTLQSGGSDNWGNQVVVSNATLTGDGTLGDPLTVVDNWYNSLAELQAAVSNDFHNLGGADSVSVDTFLVQYCDGCALASRWIRSGDTIYIDTSSSATGSSEWTRNGGIIYPNNTADLVVIGSTSGTAPLTVAKTVGTLFTPIFQLKDGTTTHLSIEGRNSAGVQRTTITSTDAEYLYLENPGGDVSVIASGTLNLEAGSDVISHSGTAFEPKSSINLGSDFWKWQKAYFADTLNAGNLVIGSPGAATGRVWTATGSSGKGSWQAIPSTADNWGSQVVVSDATLTGDGTAGDPLSVVDSWYNSLAELQAAVSNDFHNLGGTDSVSVDTFRVQYCDGCAVVSGWIRSGDTLYFDTSSTTITDYYTQSQVIQLLADTGAAIRADFPVNTDDQTAAEVSITDAGAYYSSSHVEGALQEIGLDISNLQSGGSDNWGSQVVASDATLTGDGTAGDPLSVADPSKWTLAGDILMPKSIDHNVSIGTAISSAKLTVEEDIGGGTPNEVPFASFTDKSLTYLSIFGDSTSQGTYTNIEASDVDDIYLYAPNGRAILDGASGIFLNDGYQSSIDYSASIFAPTVNAEVSLGKTDKRFNAGYFAGSLYSTGLQINSVGAASGKVWTASDASGNGSWQEVSAGSDDQTASEVSIADEGAYYSSSHVEGALQELHTSYGLWLRGTGTQSLRSASGNLSGGDYSVSIGYETQASGDYSFAAGRRTVASGSYSFSGGQNLLSGNIVASGISSFNFQGAQVGLGYVSGDYSAVLAGYNNSITSDRSGIFAGNANNIGGDQQWALSRDQGQNAIIGGSGNYIIDTASGSVIIASWNSVLNAARSSAIIGGSENIIEIDAHNSVVLGGSDITATDSNTVYVPNLKIFGGFELIDGTAEPGYIITYDSSGQGSWQPPATPTSTISATAGDTITAGDFVVIADSDGKWYRADASDTLLSTTLGGIATVAALPDSTVTIQIDGTYTTTGLDAGKNYYISATAGAITATRPSATGSVIRMVGTAISSTQIYLVPTLTYISL